MGYHVMTAETPQATHRQGVVDPTLNVIALHEAGMQRQDDLRESENRRIRERVHMEGKIARLRANHNRELRVAEAARLDAIRAVDQAAVQANTAAAEVRAATLAAQVTLSAEAMRTQVAATAQAAQENLTRALDPIQEDIGELRQVQYTTAGGKAEVAETKTETHARISNVGMWIGLAITVALGVSAAFLSVAGIVVAWLLTQ